MPILPTIDLPAPKSWDEFEMLMTELCIREWRTANVTRNGRRGQTQHGVDIFGYPGDDKARLNCVQCKCVKAIDFADVKAEVEKAKNFRPAPTVYCIATTAMTDARLQEQIREAESEWPFIVYVRAWDDLQLACSRYPDLVEQFWPSMAGSKMSIARVRDIILDSEPDMFRKVFGSGSEMRFVYKSDVALAIVVPDDPGTNFEEEWIKVFPAHSLHPVPARMTQVDVVYGTQKLTNFSFVWLDDCRYLLPLPAAPAREGHIVIDPMQAALARIVGMGCMFGFDEGASRTGMRIVPEHPWSQRDWLRPESRGDNE